MTLAYSLNISNSVGSSNRAPILIVSEYHHWSQRMERYLIRLGKDIWKFVGEGPHVPILTPIITESVQVRLGGGHIAMTIPTNDDIDKIGKNSSLL